MERILIRSSNWLGDAVMSVPAVRAIKRGNPDAHISILTPGKIADVWKVVADVDEVLPLPAVSDSGLKRSISSIRSIFAVARQLRAKGFTLAVVFPNSLRTGLEVWLAGIPRRVGYAGHAPRSLLLNEVVRPKAPAAAYVGSSKHQVHHYLALAEAVGGRVEFDPTFGFPRACRRVGEIRQIALCAGAEYGPAKRWLPERFAEVVRRVNESSRCRWILVGTAKDREVAQTIVSLAGEPSNVENLCGQTSLSALIARLRNSDALVTNDTGTMHLAALLGVHTVAIFGSTEPALTGPLGQGHTILRRKADCSPCFLRECPIDFRCMKAIEADEVAAAVIQSLAVAT